MHSKENYKQGEKTTLRMGKITANETTDKGLTPKIYKWLIQVNTRKTNNSIEKWEKRPKQTFLQKTHRDGNKHMERCSTLLIIREMQIKTTMRYHFSPVRMAIIKKSAISAGEGVEKREHSCIVGGNIN